MYTAGDRRIAQLSLRQDHVFVREQARRAGLTEDEIEQRVTEGRWLVLAPGGHALAGARLTTRSLVRLAILLMPTMVVSHESAAEIDHFPLVRRGLVVVTARELFRSRHPVAIVHRTRNLPERDTRIVDGLPVTTPVRTAADLAAILQIERYRQMISKLLVAKVFTSEDLGAMAVRWCRRGRRGSAALWAVAETYGLDYLVTDSELEQKGLAVLRAGGLPVPVLQLQLPWRADEPGRVDMGYPDVRVLVEWDSRAHHLAEKDFENDRRRDAEAIAAGWRPLRFTWDMACRKQDWVCSMVWGALRAAGGSSSAPAA
jgi:hypothetical protein